MLPNSRSVRLGYLPNDLLCFQVCTGEWTLIPMMSNSIVSVLQCLRNLPTLYSNPSLRLYCRSGHTPNAPNAHACNNCIANYNSKVQALFPYTYTKTQVNACTRPSDKWRTCNVSPIQTSDNFVRLHGNYKPNASLWCCVRERTTSKIPKQAQHMLIFILWQIQLLLLAPI
jgi:hypothetical protein